MDLSLLWWWTSTYQNLKGWPSQKCELQSFVFQKVPIWQRPLANQLGGFEYNFRYLKRFFRKVRRKLRSAFFLKLRFLKIRLLVTWLKCLLVVKGTFGKTSKSLKTLSKWLLSKFYFGIYVSINSSNSQKQSYFGWNLLYLSKKMY